MDHPLGELQDFKEQMGGGRQTEKSCWRGGAAEVAWDRNPRENRRRCSASATVT